MFSIKFINVLFFSLLLSFTNVLSGQEVTHVNNIEFEHYTINDGLSNGYINSIFQDSKGFIWIGTGNGLNRFDGLSFKTYYYDLKDSTSIPGNDVNHIAEDTLGRLWVMTNTGIAYFDRKTDLFNRKNLFIDGKIETKVEGNACLIDSKGVLWIGSSYGIFRIPLYNNTSASSTYLKAEKFLLPDDDVESVNKNTYPSFVEDENGKVWAASYSNLLYCFDENKHSFTPVLINHPDSHSFSNKLKGFFKDSEGNFILSIDKAGLLIWERQKNIFTLYKPTGDDNGPRGTILYGIAEDNNGLLWIGDRRSDGLSIFNKKTKKFTFCQNEPLNPYTLITNKTTSIFKDKDGSMWVGSILGINKYTPGKTKFNRFFCYPDNPGKLSHNNILCFEEDKSSNLWIGTDGGGLNMMDVKSGVFTQYHHIQSDPGSISSNAIIALCEDHEGTLWAATYAGGLCMMKNGKFKTFLPDPNNASSISSADIWYVFEDSKMNLWVATLTNGLDLFDRKTGKFYHYSHVGSDSISVCNNSLVSVYEDSKHILYFTSYYGVSTIDLNSIDFSKSPPRLEFKNLYHRKGKSSLSSNAVFCVKEDKKGNIWFGTMGSGIDKLDRSTGKFTNYSIREGFPGNSVHSILVDDLDNLWLATDKGLAQFNTETNEVNVYDIQDGLLNISLKSWALKTRKGEMFFGGPDGFNSFFPDKIRQKHNQNAPVVVFTGLKIFNKPVKVNDRINNRIILKSSISETRKLELTYKENFFAFEFVGLEYTTPIKNNYAYMMEGFDKEWIFSGTKHEASYTNLDPGDYTFMVKASNSDGLWSKKITSIEIIILTPWWKTLWFRILVLSSILLFFGSVIVLRFRNLKKQKLLLEKSVASKTAELRELNASKDKFFSIIAHDLKNPFNTIIGFTDLMNEAEQANDSSLTHKYSNLINTAAHQTYRLLENLLEWANSQRGKLTFLPAKVNLAGLVNEEISFIGEMAARKNILLRNLVGDSVVIYADKNMMRTVIRNLLTNGVKFTEKGGTVTVDAEGSNENIQVSVSDTGIGMNDLTKTCLFRIDHNLGTAGTENERGTGLGLFLCKDFIEKHEGKIWVESEEGKGSTFKFTIPVKYVFK
jgi:signal transduction histidine kinase/ligand-binding sensor domain-containing protein